MEVPESNLIANMPNPICDSGTSTFEPFEQSNDQRQPSLPQNKRGKDKRKFNGFLGSAGVILALFGVSKDSLADGQEEPKDKAPKRKPIVGLSSNSNDHFLEVKGYREPKKERPSQEDNVTSRCLTGRPIPIRVINDRQAQVVTITKYDNSLAEKAAKLDGSSSEDSLKADGQEEPKDKALKPKPIVELSSNSNDHFLEVKGYREPKKERPSQEDNVTSRCLTGRPIPIRVINDRQAQVVTITECDNSLAEKATKLDGSSSEDQDSLFSKVTSYFSYDWSNNNGVTTSEVSNRQRGYNTAYVAGFCS